MNRLAPTWEATDWSVWFHRAAIVIATIVLLGGKVTTGRLLQLPMLPNIDVQIPGMLLAVLLEFVYIWRDRAGIRWNNPNLALVLVPLLAFAVYCSVAEMLVWRGGFQSLFFQDTVCMLGLVGFFGLAIRNEHDLLVLAAAAEIAALLLFMSIIAHGGGRVRGPSDQLSTSVTTFRIQLVGLCSAFYLLDRFQKWGWKLLHGLVAVCLIYATLSTAARTSILVLLSLFLAFAFYLVVVRRWRVLSIVAGIFVIGALIFAVSDRGDWLARRVSFALVAEKAMPSQVGGLAQNPDIRAEPGAPAGNVEPTAPAGIVVDPLTQAVQALDGEAFHTYCQQSLQAISPTPITVDKYSCSSYVAVPDSTHRLRMMLKALELLAANPIFGAGPEGFRLTLAYGGKEAATYTYPHNLFLDIAAHTGLIGILLMAASTLGIGVVLVRALASNRSVVFLCGIPVIYALASMTGGDIYDARAIWVLAAAITAVCGPIRFSVQRGTA